MRHHHHHGLLAVTHKSTMMVAFHPYNGVASVLSIGMLICANSTVGKVKSEKVGTFPDAREN
ncbi:hypothetical protein PanWU01x14_269690 [Parasponia andersonii]|uniref:Uncharacterized protein n=1 Tax=Parasponia andersonii TaxID=3476 RepID=A0A2P5B5G5_PARAD|nr:hypothetical protein PanWU01x14_269690 [Parasponia andersonii]